MNFGAASTSGGIFGAFGAFGRPAATAVAGRRSYGGVLSGSGGQRLELLNHDRDIHGNPIVISASSVSEIDTDDEGNTIVDDDAASMSGWTVSTLDSDEASQRSDISLQSMMQEEEDDHEEQPSQGTLDTDVSSIAFGAPALGGGGEGPQEEDDDGGYTVSSIDETHRITEIDDEERSFSSHNTISTIDSDEMSMISEHSQRQQQQQQKQQQQHLSTTANQMSQNDVVYEDKSFDDESSQLTGNSSEGYLHAYGKGDVNSFATTDTLPMSDYSDEVTPVNLLHRAALLEKRSVLFHDSLRRLQCNFSDDSSFGFDDDDDVFTYGDSETQTIDPTIDPTIEYLVQQEESENFWDHINTHGNDIDYPTFEQGGDLLTGMEIGHNILVPLKG